MPETIQKTVHSKGIRNVTLLTQAPTGTTGTMVGTSTGIEPYYFWEWERRGRMGSHTERVDVYDQWRQNHGEEEPLPDHFVTAMDLTPEEHVRVQAAIQKWVDSSISKTSNMPNHYSVEQTKELYELMYDLGCKGGTIYRDGSRDEQVLNLKKEEEEQAESSARSQEPVRSRVRPTILHGITYKKHTPIGTAYITVNSDGEHKEEPFEIFINVAKVGSDVAADAEGIGRLISLILRMPSPMTPAERAENVIAQLRSIGSGRQRGFGKNRVMSLPDAIAQAIEEHIGKERTDDYRYPELPDEEEENEKKQFSFSFNEPPADLCPVCGNATFMFIEGCKKCHSCGHSEC
jgi:ribonucleoside-diphosphate reductase alpha chain